MKALGTDDILQMTRLLSGKATADEADRVLDMINSDSLKKKAFQDLQKEWNASNTGEVEEEFFYEPVANISPSNQYFQTINHSASIHKSLKWAMLGASLVCIILFVLFFKLTPESRLIVYSTGKGERFTITLPDGSIAVLSEHSLLSYTSTFSNRTVQFKGKGYFHLNGDYNNPFEMNLAKSTIVTNDAIFYIDTRSLIKLHIIRGEVAFQFLASAEQTKINNGFAMLQINQKAVRIQVSNPNDYVWHTKKLKFDHTSLHEVLHTLSKVYNTKFIYSPAVFKNCTLLADYSQANLATILSDIHQQLQIVFTVRDNAYIVSGAGCEKNL